MMSNPEIKKENEYEGCLRGCLLISNEFSVSVNTVCCILMEREFREG